MGDGLREGARMASEGTVATCIDCHSSRLCAVYVREPKESNFAVAVRQGVPPGPGRYVIVRCSDCGSVFLHPHYFEEAAGVYSDPRYFTGYYPDNIHQGGGPPGDKKELSVYGRWMLKRHARHLLREAGVADGASVVDIGCAQGFLVRAFAENGCRAYGVEISRQAIEAQTRGLNVYHGRFRDAPFEENCFDLIVASQVFEHIVDLELVCNAMRRTLRPGGAILLSVPNDIDGFRHLVWRKRPWWLVPPMHVRYFTRMSARRIFARHGFSLVRVSTEGSVFSDLNAILRWFLRRSVLRGVAHTRAYKAVGILLDSALKPIDWMLNLGGRHANMMLVLRRATKSQQQERHGIE